MDVFPPLALRKPGTGGAFLARLLTTVSKAFCVSFPDKSTLNLSFWSWGGCASILASLISDKLLLLESGAWLRSEAFWEDLYSYFTAEGWTGPCRRSVRLGRSTLKMGAPKKADEVALPQLHWEAAKALRNPTPSPESRREVEGAGCGAVQVADIATTAICTLFSCLGLRRVMSWGRRHSCCFGTPSGAGSLLGLSLQSRSWF